MTSVGREEPADLARVVAEALRLLAPEASSLTVAVSGGPDSVAMLLLAAETGLVVAAAHLDHALRPESAEEAAFVSDLCTGLGVPLVRERIDTARVAAERGWNPEDAARRIRYQFLHRAAARFGTDLIATAHTLDDQAETVLGQLLRGTAFPSGIPPRRGKVVRPLLGVRRESLRAYLAARGVPFRLDPSNWDTARTRAWLRSMVLPLLEERFPGTAIRLSRLAAFQAEQRAYFGELAARLVREGGIAVDRLTRQPAAVQRGVIAALLEQAGAPLEAGRIETIRDAVQAVSPWRLALAPGRTFRIAYGRAEVVADAAGSEPPMPVRTVGDLPPGLPESVLELPDLFLRTRRPGDRIRLPGGTRKLQDLLVDRKVPREDRDGIAVLASGSRVLWVEGIAVEAGLAKAERPVDPDRVLMERALEEARTAAQRGELPVGAVIARGGEILAAAHNRTESLKDPTAHAEVLAIRQAARELGDWRLVGCTLVVTLEPCPMCFGAALEAHLDRVVFAAANRRRGALGTVADLSLHAWPRALEIRGGVEAEAASDLLAAFFADRRGTDGSAGGGAGR